MSRSQTAGIAVARGIRVNAHMETSRPGIYACKESLPAIREHWPQIIRPGSSYPWTIRKIGDLIGL